jgi:hypothetical protein
MALQLIGLLLVSRCTNSFREDDHLKVQSFYPSKAEKAKQVMIFYL